MTIADLIEFLDFSRQKTLATLEGIAKMNDPKKVLAWRPAPGRVHVAWLDAPSGLGDPELQHVALGAEPTVTAIEVRPATTCRATIRLEVASPAARDCRRPLSVSGRSASGLPSAASPWRNSQITMRHHNL